MKIIDKKIIDEYVNYYCIFRYFNDLEYIKDKKNKRYIYKILQFLIEDRILYRYKIKSPPYHGYNTIDKNEYDMINNFFDEKKKYMKINDINEEVYENFDKIKNEFIEIVNDKHKIFKKIYEDTNIKITVNEDFVIYKNLKITLDKRLTFLLNKIGKKKFIRLILRYCGYGITAQHCSLPINVYKFLYDEFNIKGEGFSSPLNSKLIGMKNTIFCTLFKDTDKCVGSFGPFSYKTIVKNSDKNWTVNPPYMPNIMYIAYKKIMKSFSLINRDDFMVFFLIPKWEDDKTYIKLKKCKYLLKCLEPPEGRHYMNCNGKTVYMKNVVNCMFILSKNKNINIDEKIEKLLTIWNTYYFDDVNQSNFTEPIIM